MAGYQAPKGTHDVLPRESARWSELIARFATLASRAGYGLVVSPMFEDAAVFRRGAGESSDVVSKEMYELEDKGGRKLALRPEGTASIVRAFVEHRPPVPWKVWYATPAFRYERAQAGRYRQHHQLGVEAIGVEDPDADVEVIALLVEHLRGLGLGRLELRVNSMGDANCLPAYRERLAAFLAAHEPALCDEHRPFAGRPGWRANPLRFLDCKRPECRALKPLAPRISESLCEPCAKHHARVIEGLDALGVGWVADDTLVRGFDYYTRTTFEVSALSLDAAQDVVGGGGRYNGLSETLGGPPAPGVGFGSGIERVLLACDAEQLLPAPDRLVDVFVVDLVGGDAARDLAHQLRQAGISCDRSFDDRSMKAQLRQADRSGALVALIVGGEERSSGTVALRPLRRAGGPRQSAVPRDGVLARTAELLVELSGGLAGEQTGEPAGDLPDTLGTGS